ncbi:MAG TPA: DHA2 family efflux MFS transporter permease subunit [Rhodothermales bacterium]|nr:DHA2 family efflux MFS transporter permease subunit [Rhodothermales bacterium]
MAATATLAHNEAGQYANKYIIAAAVSLASMLQVIDSSIVNVAIPNMMGNLGVTIDEISLVSTSYIIASVIVIPMTGWLASFFGRKRYFAASIMLFTFASFMCGTARSLEVLVFWRIVQGIGGGALLATSQAILYESFPREEAGTAMAFFGLGIMVGPTIGPTLGGWITDHYNWPWIFYINVPLGILAALMVIAYVHNSEYQQKSNRIDYMGIALLIVSVGALQWMLEKGEQYDWFDSSLVVTLAVAAVLGLVLLLWRELTATEPVIDFRVMKNLQFSTGVVLGVIMGAGLFGSVFVFPLFLQNLLQMTAWQTGKIILPGAIATAIAMGIVGRLSDRMDNRVLYAFGTLLFALAMWKFSHLTAQSGAHDFFWPVIFRGFGLGMMFVPLTNLTLAEIEKRNLGQATGLYNFFRQMGGSFSIAVVASLLTRFTFEKYALLADHVTMYDAATRSRLAALTHGMIAKGADPFTAKQQALHMIGGIIHQQASVLSFNKVYLLSGIAVIITLPLLLVFRSGRPTGEAGGHSISE